MTQPSSALECSCRQCCDRCCCLCRAWCCGLWSSFTQWPVAAATAAVFVTLFSLSLQQVAPFDLLAGLERLSPQQLQQRAAAVSASQAAAGAAEAAAGKDGGQQRSETAAQRILVSTGLSQPR